MMQTRRMHAVACLLIVFVGSCTGHCARDRSSADHRGRQSRLQYPGIARKDVLFLQAYLHWRGLDVLPNEILFGDGKAGGRDVQFDDPNLNRPR